MLIKLIRLLRGYVVFKASGKFPERLINILNKNGVVYWDILPDGKDYIGSMLLYDYKKIRPLAKKAEVKLRCVRKRGFPFAVNKYRARKGLLLGAVLGLVIMYALSGFVWDVKINGADKLSEASINSALEECGLKSGVLKSSVDFEAVERKLIMKVPEIRWISINALNCIAEVEIKEEIKKPKLKKGKYPCNLTAECDGIITDTVVKKGTCEIKKGSAVIKNQLLVSCVVKGTNEEEDKLRFVHCDGKIYADIKYKKKFIIPKKNNNIILNSNYTEKTNLNFLWFTTPFTLNSSSGEFKSENFFNEALKLNGVTLPLSLEKSKLYEFKRAENKLNKASAEKLLIKNSRLSEIFNIGKYKIVKDKYSLKEIKDNYILKKSYIVNKNIAVEKKVKIEK